MTKNHKSAFTLVELLITATIVVLLALVALPSFGKYNRSKNLKDKAEEVKDLLENTVTVARDNEDYIATRYITYDSSSNALLVRQSSTPSGNIIKTVNLGTDLSASDYLSSTDLSGHGDYIAVPYKNISDTSSAPEKRSFCLYYTSVSKCNLIDYTATDKSITVLTISDSVINKSATIKMEMVGVPLIDASAGEYLKNYLPVKVTITYE